MFEIKLSNRKNTKRLLNRFANGGKLAKIVGYFKSVNRVERATPT